MSFLCVFVLKPSLHFLCVLATSRPCVESFLFFLCVAVVNRITFRFTLSADCSLALAATTPQMARGGHTRTTRCICVISATSAELTASQKCQFSALFPHIRLSFQREIVTNCKICNSYHLRISDADFPFNLNLCFQLDTLYSYLF